MCANLSGAVHRPGRFTNHLDYAPGMRRNGAAHPGRDSAFDPDFVCLTATPRSPSAACGAAPVTNVTRWSASSPIINRTLERHGQLDTFAVVKFHSGGKVGTTSEGSYPSTIKTDQPWFGEMTIGDWFWYPGISYDSGGAVVPAFARMRLSRDGALAIIFPTGRMARWTPAAAT